MNSRDHIFELNDEQAFSNMAMEMYHYHLDHNPVYRQYVLLLNKEKPRELKDIPFLPVELFKTSKLYAAPHPEQTQFKSSGTGGDRSTHFIADLGMYRNSFSRAYTQFIGNPTQQVILALLPNYLEQGESSLVYMVDDLIRQSNDPLSGFVLADHADLFRRYRAAVSSGKTVVLFGVSYALLDLAERGFCLDQAVIIETGGMKGRRKELSKEVLHATLKSGLKVKSVMSEYGMTELLSQAYCGDDLIFHTPGWMKVLIRDVNDPFAYVEEGKTGGINVIDLANIYSCPFIATQDLGKITGNGFEVLGRFDQAEIRGCNLLVQ